MADTELKLGDIGFELQQGGYCVDLDKLEEIGGERNMTPKEILDIFAQRGVFIKTEVEHENNNRLPNE